MFYCWFQWASKRNFLDLSSVAPPAGRTVCYSTLHSVSLPELHSFFIDHRDVVAKIQWFKTDAFSCIKLLTDLRSAWFLSHNVPTIPPKTTFSQWSLYYHCSNLNAHCSNNHPVPIFDCSNLVSCYREVCSYFLQNIVYRCNYHLFVICYRLCAKPLQVPPFSLSVCVCVCVCWWTFCKTAGGQKCS